MGGLRRALGRAMRGARDRVVELLAPAARGLGIELATSPASGPGPVPIPEATFGRESELVGIDLREGAQREMLNGLARFRGEYEAFPRGPTPVAHEFHLDNPNFGPVDAEVYWAMLRILRPRRVIEVGAGQSTFLAAAALARNRAEGAPAAELVAIEPFPAPALVAGFPGLTRLEARRLEEVEPGPFGALGPGDVLFVDSSHRLAIGNDVRVLFGEVIPRLAPGVHVHVHDVFLPGEYPREWMVEQGRDYTEQYLLQAFLAFNAAFEVVWGSAWMARHHPAALAAAIPSFVPGARIPGSFWFRRAR